MSTSSRDVMCVYSSSTYYVFLHIADVNGGLTNLTILESTYMVDMRHY